MVKPPNVVGLILCEQVIVEETTRNMTLINTSARLRCGSFPSAPQRFCMYAVLTDGLGEARMSAVIARLDTFDEVYARDWQMRFVDPLRETRLAVRFGKVVFPIAARYQVSLHADGELIGQSILQVSLEG